MKIIILAAGKGERLRPLTRKTPKSLLDMGKGKTLLEEQIERMQVSRVIDEIVLVVGYLADQIEAEVQRRFKSGLNIRTIFNPFYELSNNLFSLWFAKNEMKEDFLIANGDCLFSSNIYKELVKGAGEGIFLCTSDKKSYDEEDMKVLLDKNRIVEVSKEIAKEKADAESPGLALVRGDKFRKIFIEKIESLVKDRNYLDKFWLEVFNCLVRDQISVLSWPFGPKVKWQEIDFHLDIEQAKKLLRIQVI